LLMITTLLPSSTREMGLREGQPSPSFPLKGVDFTDGSPLHWGEFWRPRLPTEGCSPEPMRGKMSPLGGNPSKAGRRQFRTKTFLRRLSIPSLTEGDLCPLSPRKVKLHFYKPGIHSVKRWHSIDVEGAGRPLMTQSLRYSLG